MKTGVQHAFFSRRIVAILINLPVALKIVIKCFFVGYKTSWPLSSLKNAQKNRGKLTRRCTSGVGEEINAGVTGCE